MCIINALIINGSSGGRVFTAVCLYVCLFSLSRYYKNWCR